MMLDNALMPEKQISGNKETTTDQAVNQPDRSYKANPAYSKLACKKAW